MSCTIYCFERRWNWKEVGAAHREPETRTNFHAAGFVSTEDVQTALDRLDLPVRKKLETRDMAGPTGESNRLSLYPRGVFLCLGPSFEQAKEQARQASEAGCPTLIVAPGASGKNTIAGCLDRAALTSLKGFDAAVLWSDEKDLRQARQALSARDGALIPLITELDFTDRCVLERHVCIDTTAAGGNASLLAANS